jgi:hypothetical protein
LNSGSWREPVSDRDFGRSLNGFVSGEDAMTYAIHASRDGQSIVTIRISPVAAVDKARLLEHLGWRVHITDSVGHQFGPSDFYLLLMVDRETA